MRVLDLLHPYAHDSEPDYLNPNAEYVFGDIQDPEVVVRCLDGVDAVSHQAALVGLGTDFDDVVDYVRHNDLGTGTLLRALAKGDGARRLVLASSMVVYGEGRYRCDEHGVSAGPPQRASDLEAGSFEPSLPSVREIN